MKEQLAAMTIIELVKKSHEVASQPLDYYVTPVIITELASRLEALNLVYIGAMNNLRSATSTIDQLEAENVARKNHIIDSKPAVDLYNRWADSEDKIPKEPETPATDAFLREQMAKGVEAFAKASSDKASSCSLKVHAGYWTHAKESAQDFAAKLRAGEAV